MYLSICLSIYLSICEMIRVKFDTVAAKPLYIAVCYHPKENDAKRELNGSLEKVSMRKSSIYCGSWETSAFEALMGL